MTHKGYLLATASGVAVAFAGNAQAADLPMKAPPSAPPPVAPSWTGWYVGVHAGANWQMYDAAYAAGHAAGSVGASVPAGNTTGFIGGGQIGYNWQATPSWVLGVEATISGLTGKATALPEFNHTKGNGFEGRIDWLSTLRGRVGWLMDPDTMLYGTAGVAWGGLKATVAPNGIGATSPGATKSISKTRPGWVAGAGIEHMLGGNWSHWSVALEALYVKLDDSTVRNVPSVGGGFLTKTSTLKSRAVIGQLKVNYRF